MARTSIPMEVLAKLAKHGPETAWLVRECQRHETEVNIRAAEKALGTHYLMTISPTGVGASLGLSLEEESALCTLVHRQGWHQPDPGTLPPEQLTWEQRNKLLGID